MIWKSVALSEVVSFVRGLTYSKKDEVESGGLAVLRATNISLEQRTIIYDEIRHIRPPEKLNEDKLAKVGDLLMCTASGSQSHLGKVALVTEDLGMAFGGFMAALRCNASCSPKYLFYVLTSNSFMKKLSSISEGANINNLKFSQIEDFEFQLPSLAEQQRIVAKLDAAFAQIDELKTCALTQSTQVQLLTERVLSEQTTADDELVQLSDVCGIESGLVDPKIFPYKEQIHVGAGNIVSSSNELIELKTAEQEKLTSGKYPFDATTVLYSKIRPYLKKVHLPNFNGICSADMYPLKPNSEKLDREYLFYVLLSENFTNYAIAGSARAGMPKVNRNHLFAYSFRLPPLDKQKHIIQVLNTAFASKSELDEIIQRKIAAIDSLKSAVLTQEVQSEAA